MIISVSGRRVKRPAPFPKTFRAKALAPWAGVRYSLVLPLPADVPAEPSEALHLTADIEYLLQSWDAFPTAAQQDAYDRERLSAFSEGKCLECGGAGWAYAPVGRAGEQMDCPECAGYERSL